METKYKVGDRIYHGYFDSKGDIIVDEYEILEIIAKDFKACRVKYSSAPLLIFSWNKDLYYDTYEEAYNGLIKWRRIALEQELKNAEDIVCGVKNRIKKFEEKYGKES
jgi:hypothetical protein